MTLPFVFLTLCDMVAIVDYGMGNLRSVQKGLEKAGIEAKITDSAAVLKDAEGVVLPGVGAFSAAVENLRARKLDEVILSQIKAGKPFLGICLGLQLLFEGSDEGQGAEGFGLFKGRVVRFTHGLKVPHMGWNQVRLVNAGATGAGIRDESFFYFVHSYYVAPEDESIVMGVTDYGIEFVSAVTRDNVTAVQFHPEKSQKSGLALLENFGRTLKG